MRRLSLLLLLALTPPAHAKGKPARRSPPASTPAQEPRPDSRPDAKPETAKPGKTKTYTFTGLDVEGKLKTPQLLYFFDRVKLELDTTTQQKRSFMKELEETSSDKGL